MKELNRSTKSSRALFLKEELPSKILAIRSSTILLK